MDDGGKKGKRRFHVSNLMVKLSVFPFLLPFGH
jgi:hypothetical protein